MIKILFICHGNICRSPMAEFVMKDLVKKAGLSDQFEIASAATSREEIGNPVHRGTRNKLKQYGISVDGKYAVQMTSADYRYYDYIIAMEQYNLRNMERFVYDDPDYKVHLLLDFTDRKGDIADPWYTGNFDETYDDVLEGCKGLLAHIRREIACDLQEEADQGRYVNAAGGFDRDKVRKNYKAGEEGNAAFHSKIKNEVVYMFYARLITVTGNC